MRVNILVIYVSLLLTACLFYTSCTKVNFQDPFTGEDALAVPIITLLGDNPCSLSVNDTYWEPGATAIDTTGGDTTDLTGRISIVDSRFDTDSACTKIVKYYVIGLNGIRAKEERVVVIF